MKCYQCRATVTMTVRRKRALGIRCACCLMVYCLDCSWRHFGIKKAPSWAKKKSTLRVKGWKPPPRSSMHFGVNARRYLRRLRNSGKKLEA